MMITKKILDQNFDAEAKLLSTGYRREIFLFRGFIVKRIYRGYKRIKDFNLHEFQNYLKVAAKIPESYQQYFQKIYEVIVGDTGTFLISEAIMDNIDQLSKSIEVHGPIKDKNFWDQLDQIIFFLAAKDLCITDMHAKNVLVRQDKDLLIPVIVDYKTMGRDFAPWQLELLFRKGRANKMLRKYRRMKKKFALD